MIPDLFGPFPALKTFPTPPSLEPKPEGVEPNPSLDLVDPTQADFERKLSSVEGNLKELEQRLRAKDEKRARARGLAEALVTVSELGIEADPEVVASISQEIVDLLK